MSIILFPFQLVWWIVCSLFSLTGRLIGTILGLIIMMAGLALTATIIGAIIGIPLFIFGLLLMIKSLFK